MKTVTPLFYDWDRIFTATEGNSVEIIRIIRMMVERHIPKDFHDPIYKYYAKDFTGPSFLINPDLLLLNSHKHRYKDMAMYVSLASLRPMAEWAASGKVDLSALLVPVDPVKLAAYVGQNPLLSLKDGNIKFLYEETENLTIH